MTLRRPIKVMIRLYLPKMFKRRKENIKLMYGVVTMRTSHRVDFASLDVIVFKNGIGFLLCAGTNHQYESMAGAMV